MREWGYRFHKKETSPSWSPGVRCGSHSSRGSWKQVQVPFSWAPGGFDLPTLFPHLHPSFSPSYLPRDPGFSCPRWCPTLSSSHSDIKQNLCAKLLILHHFYGSLSQTDIYNVHMCVFVLYVCVYEYITCMYMQGNNCVSYMAIGTFLVPFRYFF